MDSGASIDRDWGLHLLGRQLTILVESGLYSAANEVFIGLNGNNEDAAEISRLLPSPDGQEIIVHGPEAKSLLPTMQVLHEWLPRHEDWAVCFFHMKGATHPRDPFFNFWRECMEGHVIWNWRQCVEDLRVGYDAVGCHWTHNSPNDPNAARWGGNSYFAGVYWWATAKYLLTLPPLPEKIIDRHSWFQCGELWLGCGSPRIRDYHSGPVTQHA